VTVIDTDCIRLIVKATKNVTGEGTHELHVPSLNDTDKNAVRACIETGYVSSDGPQIEEFETAIKNFTRADFAIAVNSGTSALHVALICVGVRADHEVLIPSLTFAGTGNAALYSGAKLNFVESCINPLGIDIQKLAKYLKTETSKCSKGNTINKATGRHIKALVPVHLFGHISNIDNLLQICEEYNLALVEDAAEALGSFYNGIHAGLFGNCGILSFNGNKTITTGGGGCVITNDPHIAMQARHISSTSKIPHSYEYKHDAVGFNYRMPSINAALGVSQIARLKNFLDDKHILFKAYKRSFSNVSSVELYEHHSTGSNYWLQTLVLEKANHQNWRSLMKRFHENNLRARPIWNPLHSQPPYRNFTFMDLSQTEDLALRIVNIPSSCYLANHLR